MMRARGRSFGKKSSYLEHMDSGGFERKTYDTPLPKSSRSQTPRCAFHTSLIKDFLGVLTLIRRVRFGPESIGPEIRDVDLKKL
jgi:hypothetical protein